MPIFARQRKNLAEYSRHLVLVSYTPSLMLEGLATGVDNLRYDVFLSPQFVQVTRAHLMRLIARHGGMEDMLGEETAGVRRFGPAIPQPKTGETNGFKSTVAELHVSALHHAKAEGNVSVDLLARLAVIKFLRAEMLAQFAVLLERCHAKIKLMESPRQASLPKVVELRERTSAFRFSKKSVLRKVSQDVLQTLREVEKETLARTRRSLLGSIDESRYELLLNRLLFSDEGRDDVLNAEHYVMLGNFGRDPDRFQAVHDIVCQFLRSLDLPSEPAPVDELLSFPGNADEMLGDGTPDVTSARARTQSVLLRAWVELLESHGMMEYVLAAYHVVPLLGEYSPTIHPQQLKNALISRNERNRVEKIIEQHPRLSPDNLRIATERLARCRGQERARLAARYLRDFMLYHRDLDRLEALNQALDLVNVITTEKLRELSAVNRTLYEFLLPQEQKPAEARVLYHVIVKADIRDSTALVRQLSERGLNPASFFSLNFYDPVNKLLPKYNATKLFIEGDAVILALFAYEGEAEVAVARACALAREMLVIVGGYNELSSKSGLPALELGIGISLQEGPPLYLLDGSTRIMISQALNQSDRLASCSRAARRLFAGEQSVFNVYCFQRNEGVEDEELLASYNIGGIHLDAPAFTQLAREVTLVPCARKVNDVWGARNAGTSDSNLLFSCMVPLGPGMFQKLVIRQARVPQVDRHTFQVLSWTPQSYYEVCTTNEIYEMLEQHSDRAAATISLRD